MAKNLVIIPVYNEEETIEAVFAELCRHYNGDVLIVDDGSTDRSLEKINCCCGHNLHIIRHATNQGYGQSLIDGFQYALSHDFDIAVTMDCDLQHLPRQVPQFVRELEGCDILSGSRYLEEQAENDSAPKERAKINRIITEEINRMTGFGITDAFCGFKAYRVDALRKLRLTETGYGFPLQLWVQAHQLGLTVKEISVARIYKNLNRTFGAELDDPERRLKYYRCIMEREQGKCLQVAAR